jgi:hypothetical protein
MLHLFFIHHVSDHDTDISAQIRRRRVWLQEKLSARKVSREMFKKGALEPKELDYILGKKSDLKAAKALLRILLKSNEREIHNCFLETLRQVGQTNIYEALVLPGLWPSMII